MAINARANTVVILKRHTLRFQIKVIKILQLIVRRKLIVLERKINIKINIPNRVEADYLINT